MRLLQKPKEETPSLSLWLSRDVPHEREFAGEFLNQLGHEKSLEYLLRLHDVEETLRQKRLRRWLVVALMCGLVSLAASGTIVYAILFKPGLHLAALRIGVPFIWICTGIIYRFTWVAWRGRRKKTPWLSTTVQQNVVTALLDYADNPLVADALSRALVYYTGDRDRLYDRLAHVLSRLTNDPDALTHYARQVLERRLSPTTVYPYPGEKDRSPALKAAIMRYFARTGKPGRSRKEKPRPDA